MCAIELICDHANGDQEVRGLNPGGDTNFFSDFPRDLFLFSRFRWTDSTAHRNGRYCLITNMIQTDLHTDGVT